MRAPAPPRRSGCEPMPARSTSLSITVRPAATLATRNEAALAPAPALPDELATFRMSFRASPILFENLANLRQLLGRSLPRGQCLQNQPAHGPFESAVEQVGHQRALGLFLRNSSLIDVRVGRFVAAHQALLG